MVINQKEIIIKLHNRFGKDIVDSIPFPKPYPDNIKSPKAILIGCDPTNLTYNIKFEYVFALERVHIEFSPFLKKWDDSLSAVGLSFNNIYTQNLCRNYFAKKTSKNPIWNEAAEFWIEYLFEDLKKFDRNIPVLMSSERIYKVLINKGEKKIEAKYFYNHPASIPIPPDNNKLNRPLIPFYRYWAYTITKEEWVRYRRRIIDVLSYNVTL